ncbi:N-acetyltransferase [Hymenobacter oligotrophus]|uniref:N-acetyltransferase n=1 Tax=Hymenobacter oligotrophus TaxID=2319843 RepID=A0A3B7RPT5_9BACT|nr:GNAT family N-acetyltransferase [Hymenobacter oligotrophus]AYA36207.1 N-acetyltransferase [Hymenobacter oligotrophus]
MIPLPETPRLALRRISPADFEVYFRLNTDPHIMRYTGPPKSEEVVRQYLANMAADYERWPDMGRFLTVEKASENVVGLHLLKPLDQTEMIEVGYRLLPEYWGRGYATEMAQALVQYGFSELNLPQIVGVTLPANVASQHVLEKCGLRYQKQEFYYGFEQRFYAADNPTLPTPK